MGQEWGRNLEMALDMRYGKPLGAHEAKDELRRCLCNLNSTKIGINLMENRRISRAKSTTNKRTEMHEKNRSVSWHGEEILLNLSRTRVLRTSKLSIKQLRL